MLYVLLLLSLILCCVAAAQNAGIAQPPAITAPAMPPLPVSPVDTFRKILAMSEPEREKFLTTYKPENRQVVISKLAEYQSLSPQEREARLRALQVRVYVRQLIKLPSSNRVERLVHLPPGERQMVEGRLNEWDQLPADLQKEVLASEWAIRHIARSPDGALHRFTPPLPTAKLVTKIEGQLADWRNIPAPRRSEILDQFQRFFEEVPAQDRAKILAERPDMPKTLIEAINRLPSREQRERYIANFQKFAALTPAERHKFMLNASQWQKMSPQEQESWRILAKKLTPPPPPPPLPGSRPSVSLPGAAGEQAALDVAADPSGH